jgi:hypothetical protein
LRRLKIAPPPSKPGDAGDGAPNAIPKDKIMTEPKAEETNARVVVNSTGSGNAGWLIGGAVLAVAIIAGVVWYNSRQEPAPGDTTITLNTPPAIEINPIVVVPGDAPADAPAQ